MGVNLLDPDFEGHSHYKHRKSEARVRREKIRERADLELVNNFRTEEEPIPPGAVVVYVHVREFGTKRVFVPAGVDIRSWLELVKRDGLRGTSKSGRTQYVIPYSEIDEIKYDLPTKS